MVDDLRPEINCITKPLLSLQILMILHLIPIYTKMRFVTIPVCGASRASMLTGLRPNKNRFKTFKSRIDVDAPSVETIGSWFKNNSYYTLSFGKITPQERLSKELV